MSALHAHHSTRRRFLHATGLSLAGLLAASQPSRAADDPERTAATMLTAEAQSAIDRALAYLAGQQIDEGSLGSSGYARDVAVVALAGMAFMAAGSTPDRGPYGAHVSKCIDFILSNTQDGGFINVRNSTSYGPMYGHGFATLFLAEVYGMSGKSDVREKLAAAVKLITDTQNDEGGWRYQPQRREADLSVTICQVMALRAARNAGVFVSPEVIDRTIRYVKKSQNADGGFRYMIEGGQSAFPRSAAGVVALYSAGIYDGPELERGLKYLMENLPAGGLFNRESHYFYGHYYAVQAMWHAGGKYWQRWYPFIRDELIARQRPEGAWMDSICQEYGTAMACIILQMPNNYLPIFQR